MMFSLTRQSIPRTYLFLNSRIKSFLMVTGIDNLYTTGWPFDGRAKVSRIYYYSTVFSTPRVFQMQLNKKITSLKTIEDLLELFNSNESANAVNRLTILHNIAKISQKDAGQWRGLLEQDKLTSAYRNLLDTFSKDVSNCNPRFLANLIWALGKMQEKNHGLVEVCKKEILSRDVSEFSNTQVCQIMNACSLLGVKGVPVISKVEEAILQGKLNPSTFKEWQLNGALMSFAKTGKGSEELYGQFLLEILRRDLTKFDNQSLVGFLWSFGELEIFDHELFTRVGEEILRRGSSGLKCIDIVMTLTAFAKVTKGCKELLTGYDDDLLSTNTHEAVGSDHIHQQTQLFDFLEIEVIKRGLSEFKAYHLVWIVWSFVKTARNSQQLIKDCLNELCLRDLTHLDNGSFSSLAWCMGRSGLVNNKLFDKIEQIVLQRDASDLNIQQICALQRGLVEAKRGSKEIFQHLDPVTREKIRELSATGICDLLWSVSNAGFETNLLGAIEREVLRRGKSYFKVDQLKRMKKSFIGAELKGSTELYEMLEVG